jgi:hypothetical protein
MKKENLIISLLIGILLLLGYQSVVITRFLSSSPQADVKVMPENPDETPSKTTANPYANANLKAEILTNKDGTFGYRILLNGSPMIVQANIPALPGNAGFSDAAKAEKTAMLILHKIRNNIMPPAVSIEELDSIGVL